MRDWFTESSAIRGVLGEAGDQSPDETDSLALIVRPQEEHALESANFSKCDAVRANIAESRPHGVEVMVGERGLAPRIEQSDVWGHTEGGSGVVSQPDIRNDWFDRPNNEDERGFACHACRYIVPSQRADCSRARRTDPAPPSAPDRHPLRAPLP